MSVPSNFSQDKNSKQPSQNQLEPNEFQILTEIRSIEASQYLQIEQSVNIQQISENSSNQFIENQNNREFPCKIQNKIIFEQFRDEVQQNQLNIVTKIQSGSKYSSQLVNESKQDNNIVNNQEQTSNLKKLSNIQFENTQEIELNKIKEDLINVISNISLPDNEKAISIKQKQDQLKLLSNKQLKKIIGRQEIRIMSENIADGSSESGKAIIDLIEMLINRGTRDIRMNRFFNNIKSSRLLNKIESLISEQLQKQQKQDGFENVPNSEFIEKLLKIYIVLMKNKEIKQDTLQKYEQLINKSSYNMLGSSLLSETEKQIKAQRVIEDIKNQNNKQFKLMLDQFTLVVIKLRLGNCLTQYEMLILSIINQLISHSTFQSQDAKKFYEYFKQIGIISKIESLIEEEVKLDNKENINELYSISVEQLIKAYFKIMDRKNEEEVRILDTCIRFFDRNITNILKKLKNQTNDPNENELKRIIEFIKIFEQFRLKENSGCLTNPSSIKKVIVENVSLLFHINCDSQLHCPLSINVHLSPEIEELHHVIYNSLMNAIYHNSDYKNLLINDHNIFPHISSVLNSFIKSNSYHLELNKDKQQSQLKSFSQQQTTIDALGFLSQLIIYNNDNIQKASNTPNIISALIQLYNFKMNEIMDHDYQMQLISIGKQSHYCLNCIKENNNSQIYSQMLNQGYLNILIQTLTITRRIIINIDNKLIFNSLTDIVYLFSTFHKGKMRPLDSFPSNYLLQNSYYKLEEEGGNEEVEAYFANQQQQYRNQSRYIKLWILNICFYKNNNYWF